MTITFLHGCSNEADHSAVAVGKISPTHSIVTYRCEWNDVHSYQLEYQHLIRWCKWTDIFRTFRHLRWYNEKSFRVLLHTDYTDVPTLIIHFVRIILLVEKTNND